MTDHALKTVHIVSLGCAKNRVDSEVIMGLLGKAGYRLVARPEEAELVLVNTCGFIEAARTESVDAVLEAAELKRTGQLRKMVVTRKITKRRAVDIRVFGYTALTLGVLLIGLSIYSVLFGYK